MARTEVRPNQIANELTNADIAADAAIAGTKVSPSFGTQGVSTTGLVSAGTLKVGTSSTAGHVLAATDNLGNVAFAAPVSGVTYPLLAPDGSVTAPSFSFSGATNTGIYRAGGQLYFAHNGANSGYISGGTLTMNTGFFGSNGTAASPTFGFGSAAGTGMFALGGALPELMFSSNGAERVRIDDVGNVGIGTTSPTYKLHVGGTGYFSDTLSMANLKNIHWGNSARIWGNLFDGHLFFQTAGGESSIKAGWFETPQGYRAKIIGSGYAANTPYFSLNSTGGTIGIGSADGAVLDLITGSTRRLTVLSTGNVGIGTTSPDTTLHVTGSIKMVDTNQGAGKVLTDVAGTGVASWQTPAGGSDNHLNSSLADATASGITLTGLAGENLAAGDICYRKSDGKYWKADASAAASMPGVALATAAITAEATGTLLSHGFYRNDALYALTVGGVLYVSETPGGVVQTAPTTSGAQVQAIGYAYSADVVFFMPSLTMVGIA